MGREISERPDGTWWIVETTSNAFMRVSRVFASKEELLGTLRRGGLNESIFGSLEKENYICSMGPFGNADKQVDEALQRAGSLDKTGHDDCLNPEELEDSRSTAQAMQQMHEQMDTLDESEESGAPPTRSQLD